MGDVEEGSEFAFASENNVAKGFFGGGISGGFPWNIDNGVHVDEAGTQRSTGDVLAKRPDANKKRGARRATGTNARRGGAQRSPSVVE